MIKISNKDVAQAIFLSIKDKTGLQLNKIFENINELLRSRHLLSQSFAILENLEKLINEEKKILIAKVFTPFALSSDIKNNLISFIKQKYFAKEVILTENIDKNLIGGIKIEANDEIIDFSLQNKITELQKYLNARI